MGERSSHYELWTHNITIYCKNNVIMFLYKQKNLIPPLCNLVALFFLLTVVYPSSSSSFWGSPLSSLNKGEEIKVQPDN